MSITREQFEQGLTYEAFKAQMTRNQERFNINEQLASFESEDLAVFTNLAQTLDVLVIAEDWCGDVIDNLPILGRLAKESGKLNLRIFLRDQNLDIMDQYLNKGQFRSIPVFVFFDEHFTELGHFIERPESVTKRRGEVQKQLSQQYPELADPNVAISQLPEEIRLKLSQAMMSYREESRKDDIHDVLAAIRAIIHV
jgi:hypothetical protein